MIAQSKIMRRDVHRYFSATIAAVLLAGCTGSGDRYPSLAIRDAERVTGQFAPATPAPEPLEPIVSTGSLAALVNQARKSHMAFEETVPGARSALIAARGSSPQDNRWAVARIALADLTTHRSDTAIVLADLDLLLAEAATTFAPGEDIASAQSEVATLLADQDRILAILQSELSG